MEAVKGGSDDRRLGNPGTPEFRVEKYPFYLLNRLVSRYNTVIGTGLRAIGIDIPTWRVLMILGEREPRAIAEIADAAVINPSTMTRIIQRMAKAGLIECRTPPEDARVTEVLLTNRGKRKLAEARTVAAPIYARIIDGFSQGDFERLISSLNRLYDNISFSPDEPHKNILLR